MSKSGCRLSIIIPIYNMEQYLRRCLDSVVAQKQLDIEIILVDDGSVDTSSDICQEYAFLDNRIVVASQKNGGLVSARKLGLSIAKGSYIAYVDADDWIEPDSFCDAFSIIEKYSPDFIAYSFVKECGDLKVERKDYPEEGLYGRDDIRTFVEMAETKMEFFCQIICASLCCKIIKRKFLLEFQNSVPDEVVLCEDLAVTLPMLLKAESIYVCKFPYYHYCQNKSSMCWEHKPGAYNRFIILAKHLFKHYKDIDDRLYRRFILLSVYFAMMEVSYDLPHDYYLDGIPFISGIKKGSNIVVYGKGTFATGIVDVIEKYKLAIVIANVDSTDADTLFCMNDSKYDVVFIAIIDYMIVEEIKRFCIERGVSEDKIITVEKDELTIDNLPYEVMKIFK